MKQKSNRKALTVGRRTGAHIVPSNKTLKLNKDGRENFADYWQSSDRSHEETPSPKNSSPLTSGAIRFSSYFVKNNIDKRISFINPSKSSYLEEQKNVENSPKLTPKKLNLETNDPLSNKPLRNRILLSKGRRTGCDIMLGKEINVSKNVEDFKDYWTDTCSDNTESDRTTRQLSSKSLILNESVPGDTVLKKSKIASISTKIKSKNASRAIVSFVTSSSEVNQLEHELIENQHKIELSNINPEVLSSVSKKTSSKEPNSHKKIKIGKHQNHSELAVVNNEASNNLSKESIDKKEVFVKSISSHNVKKKKSSLSNSLLTIRIGGCEERISPNEEIRNSDNSTCEFEELKESCLSFSTQLNVLNNTFSRDGTKNARKKENVQESPVKKQKIIPLSVSLASPNKDSDKTQTIANDVSCRNSHKELNSSKILENTKSTQLKSRNKKRKKTLGKEKKTSAIELEGTTSGVLKETSNLNKNIKASKNSKPKSSKRKKSLISTTDSVENEKTDLKTLRIRRSTRQKIAPLESWRLERRVYGYKDGVIVNLGYEEGFPEDTSSVTRIRRKQVKKSAAKKVKKRPQKKDSKLIDNSTNMKLIQSSVFKISVINPCKGGEESLYLHRPYDTLLWSIPPSVDQEDPPYTVTKCMSGELISFGYIEIGVSKMKKEQFSPSDNITFTVLKGNVKIRINKQELCLKKLDKVTVPFANGYSIKNTGKVPALLSFCTYKIPLFDYQFTGNFGQGID